MVPLLRVLALLVLSVVVERSTASCLAWLGAVPLLWVLSLLAVVSVAPHWLMASCSAPLRLLLSAQADWSMVSVGALLLVSLVRVLLVLSVLALLRVPLLLLSAAADWSMASCST